MTYKIVALALFAAAAPAAFAQGMVPEPAAEQAVAIGQVAPAAKDTETAPAPETAAQSAPSIPQPTGGFDSKVAFSPTYSSGYYYASPHSGYTSLAYYGSIYTARGFGG
jgi:hypothetical protein